MAHVMLEGIGTLFWNKMLGESRLEMAHSMVGGNQDFVPEIEMYLYAGENHG